MWVDLCLRILAVVALVIANDNSDLDVVNSQTITSNEDLDQFSARAGCSVAISSLSASAPVYSSQATGAPLIANGTSGYLDFQIGEKIVLACPGSELLQPLTNERPESATVMCVEGTYFSSPDWFQGTIDLGEISCACAPRSNLLTSSYCESASSQSSSRVKVGIYTSPFESYVACLTEATGRVEYVTYTQDPTNLIIQNVSSPPPFQQGAYFPGLSMTTLYTEQSQRDNFNLILGDLYGYLYLQEGNYLSPGQLAAPSDFVFHNGQRTTFQYVNTAPQWENFNTGNWDLLEQSLRKRIAALGASTTVYSGTWGTLELRDDRGVMREMHLNAEKKLIPIPLYFYKVVTDAATNKATAFVGINNPHLDAPLAEQLTFCTDFCLGSAAFSWLDWSQHNFTLGYSFCCELNDFQRTVLNMPSLTSSGLFV